tara:strand:- start:6056 stop:6256 length:201 start_codon:yes stop_codon:yes gene_type:complete
MIRVEGHNHLYRDEKSGAILNCDTKEYENYVKSRNQRKLQKSEIEIMKNEITEIKSLLVDLANRIK